MQNTLVIKRGAAGDVVRTTSLLNQIHGNIYWLVDEKNKLLFPENYPGLHLLTDLDSAEKHLTPYEFDLVISLEEDGQCARLACALYKKLVGVFLRMVVYAQPRGCRMVR
jgi:heptosyltransferase-2